jgi:hypothetical protein
MHRVDEEAFTIRELEGLLSTELDNWLRYGRKKDWLPAGFKCPLGFAYKPVLGEVYSGASIMMPCNEEQALAFDRVICGLPKRHRQAFVMYHLDRAHVHGFILIVKGRAQKAQILGCSTRHYHRMVKESHEMVLSRWRAAQRMGTPNGRVLQRD